jgi:hypothetical protein
MNPFVTDTPAPTDQPIGRERELTQLADLVEGGHNCRLVAPRRYGKTSLLKRLGEEAESRGMRCVYVDLFGVVTMRDIAARIDRAYQSQLRGPVRAWYEGTRRRSRLKGKVGTAGTGVELEAAPTAADEDRLVEVLELPARLHGRDGRPTLVMFDEFQEVLGAAKSADAVIRSSIQHHRHEASYVFAGSHPGMMAALFGDRDRPLYGQSREIELGPLGDADLADYVEQAFSSSKRSVGPVMDDFLELVRGHPQRAMLVAHHLWEIASEEPTTEEWNRAVASAMAELEETFERYWGRLSLNERKVLVAVAWTGPWGGGISLLGKDTLARFALTKSTARTVSAQLAQEGDLRRLDAGGYELIDPLLEAWVASDRRSRPER